ncbi:hypothetical protein [Caulobacter sp. X]|uniref:hypothetical protein n=1 Tax=Caulobacter sp. X TaxID=2048901 RepID=UPI000C15179B|nr:hypothetical protein [Caulobacter sp. X]PIB96088.1 hypothetical protein CSW60_16190 [Caulobacter sp. X]
MRLITLVLVTAAVGLAGCQSFEGYPAPLETPKAALELVRADTQPAAVTDYAAITDQAARRSKRDQIVRARLYAIDITYDDFVRGLSVQQKAFALGSDVAAAGLTGAATLAKSAATKTHLTTYAGAVLGLRATVDKELYYSKTLPAVVSQMDASRKTVLAKIEEGLSRPDADYPLVAALADLQDYYVAGTLNGALNQISKDAGVKDAAAEQRIAKVTTLKSTYDDAARKLIRYWQPDGTTPDPGHQAILVACMPKQDGVAAPTVRDMGRVVDAGSPEQKAALAECVKTKDPSFN